MLIIEWNKKVIGVFEEEIKVGKKCLVIFYGVGYMVDFYSWLIDRLDFQFGKMIWIIVWDLLDCLLK